MKIAFCILALAAFFPVIAGAQSATLAPGARVRVTSPSDNLKRHVSTVTEVRGDSIVMSSSTGSRTISLGNVTALDVSLGKQRNVARYALVGLGAGALLGVAAFSEATDDCDDDLGFCPIPVSDEQFVAVGGFLAATTGLLAGAIAGAFHKTERWEKHPSIRTSIAPTMSGGVTVRVSKAF